MSGIVMSGIVKSGVVMSGIVMSGIVMSGTAWASYFVQGALLGGPNSIGLTFLLAVSIIHARATPMEEP